MSQTSLRGLGKLIAGAAVAVAATFGAASPAAAQTACDGGSTTGYDTCVSDADAAAAAAGDLPATGSDPTRQVAIGGALIVVGGAAVIGSIQARRRSNWVR